MKLDLSGEILPVRLMFSRAARKGESETVAVFQYADGKILTASALVLDPAEWKEAKIGHSIRHPIHSPDWAGKSDEEVAVYVARRGLGKLVGDAHLPISESAEEEEIREGSAKRVRQCSEPRTPKSVTKVTEDDYASDEEFLGTTEETS